MLSNLKNWIQSTAVSIVDENSIRKPATDEGTLQSTSNLNLLKFNSLNQSTSSLRNNADKTHRNESSQSVSEIDLSYLSREEKEHIEYVLKKAEEDL